MSALPFPSHRADIRAMALPPITVYRTSLGIIAQRGEDCFLLADITLDDVFTQADPLSWLEPQLSYGQPVERPPELLAPIQSQEIWAAGFTCLRPSDARIEDGTDGGSFREPVHAAGRPALFFKVTSHRIVAPGAAARIHTNAKWNLPEPALVLAVNSRGQIFAYTIGNEIISRDIDGGNPLHFAQAKVQPGCCALGPGIVVREPLPRETAIEMRIHRAGAVVFSGATSLSRMNRPFDELAALLRGNAFPAGCLLLAGTGLVPPDDFTLQPGDQIAIAISSLGTLSNVVA